MRTGTWSVTLPQHPLLRGLVLLVAIVLGAGLLAAGLLLGITVLAIAATTACVVRWRHRRQRQAHDAAIIEGEFTVVPPQRETLPHTD